eukprot:PhF_6_TR28319/c0_g1_i1/m.41951
MSLLFVCALVLFSYSPSTTDAIYQSTPINWTQFYNTFSCSGILSNGQALTCVLRVSNNLTCPCSLSHTDYDPINFRIEHDGCTHYLKSSCPSTSSPIQSTGVYITSEGHQARDYTFTWNSPPVLGGNTFTLYFMWNRKRDAILNSVRIMTAGGASTSSTPQDLKLSMLAVITSLVMVLMIL